MQRNAAGSLLCALVLASFLALAAGFEAAPKAKELHKDGQQPGLAPNKEAYITFLAPYVAGEGSEDAGLVDWYFVSARYLLYRLMKHEATKTKEPRDFLVMVLPGIDTWKRVALEQDGARVLDVPEDVLSLLSPRPSWWAMEKRWKYNFAKLHAWNLEEYERVAYIDADIWVRSNMDGMFGYVADFPFAAVRDLHHNVLLGLRTLGDGFNAGLFALQPSKKVFLHMVGMINDVGKYNIHDMEQGFLNYYYGSSWYEIPREYSGNHLDQVSALNYSRSAHEKMWSMLHSPGSQGEMARLWLSSLLEDMPEFQQDPRVAEAGTSRLGTALAQLRSRMRKMLGFS